MDSNKEQNKSIGLSMIMKAVLLSIFQTQILLKLNKIFVLLITVIQVLKKKYLLYQFFLLTHLQTLLLHITSFWILYYTSISQIIPRTITKLVICPKSILKLLRNLTMAKI